MFWIIIFLCKTHLQQIENVTKPVLIVILQSLLQLGSQFHTIYSSFFEGDKNFF